MRFSSPSGFTRRYLRTPNRVAAASHGISSPSAHTTWRVHSSRVYLARYVPSTGFLTLLTVFSSPSLPALFHAGNARGVSPFRGFPSRGAALPPRKCITLLAFFPARCLHLQPGGGGRPLPRHLGFREGPFDRLQGFYLPKSPSSTANSFRFYRGSIPSWAFSFLRSSPRAQMQRISPPLLSRAFAGFSSESKLPARPPACTTESLSALRSPSLR
jgi:hypothetical protein